MTRLIIAGSRDCWSLPEIVDYAILRTGFKVPTSLSIRCGLAKGADTAGQIWALQRKLEIKYFPVTQAEWRTHGKKAGYLRNVKMAACSDALLAIWDGRSPGTRNMIEIADNCGLAMYVYKY